MKIPVWMHVFALVVILALPQNAGAQGVELFTNGNGLLSYCEKGTDAADGICLGFISGVIEGVALAKPARPPQSQLVFCAPEAATVGQMVKVVVKYLHDHPAELHRDSAALVMAALRTAWPCR